jgi:hypothetical protein
MEELDMTCHDCGIRLSMYLTQGSFEDEAGMKQVAQILDWEIGDQPACLVCKTVKAYA